MFTNDIYDIRYFIIACSIDRGGSINVEFKFFDASLETSEIVNSYHLRFFHLESYQSSHQATPSCHGAMENDACFVEVTNIDNRRRIQFVESCWY